MSNNVQDEADLRGLYNASSSLRNASIPSICPTNMTNRELRGFDRFGHWQFRAKDTVPESAGDPETVAGISIVMGNVVRPQGAMVGGWNS